MKIWLPNKWFSYRRRVASPRVHEIPRVGSPIVGRPVEKAALALSLDQTRDCCKTYRVAYFGSDDENFVGLIARNLSDARKEFSSNFEDGQMTRR